MSAISNLSNLYVRIQQRHQIVVGQGYPGISNTQLANRQMQVVGQGYPVKGLISNTQSADCRQGYPVKGISNTQSADCRQGYPVKGISNTQSADDWRVTKILTSQKLRSPLWSMQRSVFSASSLFGSIYHYVACSRPDLAARIQQLRPDRLRNSGIDT